MCALIIVVTLVILVLTVSTLAQLRVGNYDYYELIDGFCTDDHVTPSVALWVTSTTHSVVLCHLRCELNPECGSVLYDADDGTCQQMYVNYMVCDDMQGIWNKVSCDIVYRGIIRNTVNNISTVAISSTSLIEVVCN